ncbi:hypothetical protein BACOVA_04971 [Bacteroides ovatus ATCC 8483]|uniref:Uncharacterized protein n=1 Tax=Bacteroides ovatus (strain ATCC 8483 / DSM 1896 / JCM 5824 / BCRC 10623 / CCUG 4943 / NCTC 11153) TaxID=411476 RepID=A0AAN3A3H0_BACO1|nr:hypothetical protein BACOVA_04971 [Bacteroides ovatus ATCC 8483]
MIRMRICVLTNVGAFLFFFICYAVFSILHCLNIPFLR